MQKQGWAVVGRMVLVLMSWLAVGPVTPAQAQVMVSPGQVSLEGNVLDGQTRQPIAGALITVKASPSGTVQTVRVPADGSFKLLLDPRQVFLITTRADGYQAKEERVATTDVRATRLYGKMILLTQSSLASNPELPAADVARTPPPRSEPAPAPQRTEPVARTAAPPPTTPAPAPAPLSAASGSRAELRRIQFVQSTPSLLPESQPELERILAFLRDNPAVRVELSGHTDNQGDFDKNVQLSRQRADAIKAYLVQNGIAADRIQTRGYGPSRPIASNSREETRRLNRRVEMTVL